MKELLTISGDHPYWFGNFKNSCIATTKVGEVLLNVWWPSLAFSGS